ncbi:MAG: transglycosylase SLT domain-containing protein [Rhodoferax sp.]
MRLSLFIAAWTSLWLAGCATAPNASAPLASADPVSVGAVAAPTGTAAPAPTAAGTPAAGPSTAPAASGTAAATATESLRLRTAPGWWPSTPGERASAASPLQSIELGADGERAVAQLAAPNDLWERIRRGFAMPDLQNDLVQDREQWYLNRPDYIFRMTERSRKYLFHIVEELELRGMPTELALLPFIESAFNPQAVSVAKAAGMWQFMPATGRTFDLKQNTFRDDRRDVLASTRAALDYLQKLYRMFGDWHLALAAYNWGEGSVKRAIDKSARNGGGSGYTEIRMPNETRYYVPKLQAVKNIIAHPEAYNARLPDIGNHPFFDAVDIQRDIDVALAARLAEVSVEEFRALNPSMNKPVILAAGTPQILLPWDNAEVFKANLEGHSGRLASWTAWIVPSNMGAAQVAQRVGMSESQLREVNRIPPRMLIRAGSTLLVPRGPGLNQDVSERVADNAQLSLSPEVVLRKTSVKAIKGDTVATVARRWRLEPEQVAQWNKVAANASFKPGQSLTLYLPAKAKGSASKGSSKGSSGKSASGKAKGSAKAPSAKGSSKAAAPSSKAKKK